MRSGQSGELARWRCPADARCALRRGWWRAWPIRADALDALLADLAADLRLLLAAPLVVRGDDQRRDLPGLAVLAEADEQQVRAGGVTARTALPGFSFDA